jgi:hypothetical protein
MNELEKYIGDRKSQFDEEPSAGHFERMQQKIDRKSKRIIILRRSISIAASIAIILSMSFVLWQHKENQNDKQVICENGIDMKSCYLNKMNVVAGRIEILSRNLDSWDRQQVMSDVQNIIDIAGSDFESEIPKELPEHETKLILSDYYRQNLEGLKTMEEKLKTKNNEL